jgi:glycerol-3-phosphate dehydrogenase
MTPAARRSAALQRFASRPFDLLIVGGGATGAAAARDAALRGLEVGLCDAGDFASQTSSQSSKLIHGGIRYLEYGNLPLVFEGLTERRRLMHTAPHLCRPIEFLFPGYRGERPGVPTLAVGVALYNALALWRPPASRSRKLSPRALYALEPHLRTAGLAGAVAYIDCQTDDARLVLENVLDAEANGATVANHLRAEHLLRDRRGRVVGAALADVETGARFEARARVVLSATGPFTDSFLAEGHAVSQRLRPTLGVHLVFDAARVPHQGRALVLRTPRDNRVFFSLPAGTRTVVGTTDTDWTAARPPRIDDDIRARGEDVAYLLEAANHAFPSLRLTAEDVLSTFAGLRPLLATGAHTPSETSREHEIARAADGLLAIAGGKLTTLRRMGEEAVDRSVQLLLAGGIERAIGPCATAERPLPGGGALPASLAAAGLDDDVTARLAAAYGARADLILQLAAGSADLGRRIDPELPYLWAEVVQAVRAEHARDVADVLRRRVPLFRDARDQGLGAAERVAAILAAELAWPPEQRARSLADYRNAVAASRRWRDELARAAAPLKEP